MSWGVVVREAIMAALDVLDTAVDVVGELNFDALTTRESLALLERIESVRRRLPVPEHKLINNLAHAATAEELGGKLSHAIAERTLISRAEASRRIKEAADLGPRRALTGEPLAPTLAGAAAAQKAGKLGAGQVAVIRRFYHQVPGWVDAATRDKAETHLAEHGTPYRPQQSPASGRYPQPGLADTIADCLNPD
ncbi:MAG: DUF222 domain-containing protein, partial [Mycobacterium sp.]